MVSLDLLVYLGQKEIPEQLDRQVTLGHQVPLVQRAQEVCLAHAELTGLKVMLVIPVSKEQQASRALPAQAD